ncbi:BNA4 [Symbiodinium pilosum]|uniref:BNA4 protein n=1 Tax=Symbiodinium pilosum TaxID=2952 RepID=A0A812XJA3_SYMPI|nr:BNA4 [Symbiodinium pilosum]
MWGGGVAWSPDIDEYVDLAVWLMRMCGAINAAVAQCLRVAGSCVGGMGTAVAYPSNDAVLAGQGLGVAEYIVIGAGPAGLAAAGFIAKAGSRVAVFEGRPKPENVFGSYPVVLNARGLSALESLDPTLMAKAQEIGMAVKELHIVPDNKTVAKVPTYGTCIMRDQTAHLLLEAAEAQENISFYWEHKLSSIDFQTKTCTFELPDGSQKTFSAERLVAADGNRSRVRRFCEEHVADFSADADPWGFQLRFMNSKGVPGQTEVNPDVHFVLGDKGYVCQQPNGEWSISLRVLPDSDEEFITSDQATDENVQKLKEYVQTYAKFAADNLLDDEAYRKWYDCKAFDGVVVKCSCLNPAGWICIIGDAAHAVQPATGEGINSGLEDAAVLGEMLKEHPEDPFAAFDQRQRPNAHALQKLALQAKDRVTKPPPRTQAVNLMVTIGLAMAKKLHIIEGTREDFTIGEKAATAGIKSYDELVQMDERQRSKLLPVATALAKIFRIPKEHPATQTQA